jgi:rod shape-determining protein MreC
MIDRNNSRAILTGDGGPNPRLDYLRGRDPVKQGDRILTSGDGGVLPRGLPVGTAVKGLDGHWRVVLASDRSAIDFVRILLFEDFTQVVNQKELAIMPVPPPTLGPQSVGLVAPGAAPAAGSPPAPKPASGSTAAPKPPVAASATVAPTARPVPHKPASRPAKPPAPAEEPPH